MWENGRVMNQLIEIIPSIASANPIYIAEELGRVKKFARLHLDMEDGSFVPNITFGMKTIKEIARATTQILDVHVQAAHPATYVEELATAGIRNVAVHAETIQYPMQVMHQIRNQHMRAGLALNLSTPPEFVIPFLHTFDYCIVMTAEPDGEGQVFRADMLQKIEILRGLLPREVEIWADGGIGYSELNSLAQAGATVAVMGRAIFEEKEHI